MLYDVNNPPPRAYLNCRHIFDGVAETPCDACGLQKVFPPCPTLLNLKGVKWELLSKTKKRLFMSEQVAAELAVLHPSQGAKITDSLTDIQSCGGCLYSTACDLYKRWVVHDHTHVHQLYVRSRLIELVGVGRPGQRYIHTHCCIHTHTHTPTHTHTHKQCGGLT